MVNEILFQERLLNIEELKGDKPVQIKADKVLTTRYQPPVRFPLLLNKKPALAGSFFMPVLVQQYFLPYCSHVRTYRGIFFSTLFSHGCVSHLGLPR